MSWMLGSLLVLGVALVAGFAWYERSHPSARVLALVASLAALAVIGRIAFAPLPNVKPTTDIVLLSGYVLGGAPGFAVGAVAALASNLFFGQGPWTPWQMAGWGLVGVGGGALAALAGRQLGRVSLAVACGLAGALFGAIMNVQTWVTFGGRHTLGELQAYAVTALPFDLAHVAGNVVFCLAFGPALVRALSRFRERFEFSWEPAPQAALPLAVLALALGAATAQPAGAAVPPKTVSYLLAAQNDDGGFGPAPGQRSTGLHTGWAALGLAATGRNPLDVGGARSAVDYLRDNQAEISDLGEIDRTILILAAAGVSPRAFGGRDLVTEVLAKQRPNGSFAGRVNTTAFAILALRAAGRATGDSAVRRGGRWIARQVNRDGGFNFASRGGASGIDDTGAALQALAAAGRRGTPTARRAVTFLVRRQNRDGGFGLQPGMPSNAQSTAWAVQGLLAARRNPGGVRRNGSRSPLAYLESLVGADGAVRYSRTSTQTPVWVTAQAVAALAERPLPLERLPRRQAQATRTPAATPTPTPSATPEPKPARRRPAVRAAARTAAVERALAARARRAGFLAGLAFGVVG